MGSTASSKPCRVDRVVCAEFEDAIQVRRGCGPDYVRAGCAGELYREAADAARGPVDQHALVCAEPAVVEESLPGAEAGSGIAALSACPSDRGFGTSSSAGIAV